jgi:hypothetical protein
MTIPQMRIERQVSGAKVFVAAIKEPKYAAYLRIGDGWDAIGDEYLSLTQVAELIRLLQDAYDRWGPEKRAAQDVVWQDQHLPPFNVPPTYPGLRSDEV